MGKKLIDLTGKKFGKLLVLSECQPFESLKKVKARAWLCRCDCGTEKRLRTNNLIGGETKSCGCSRSRKQNLIGKKFGLLTVIEEAPSVYTSGNYIKTRWECVCDCGVRKMFKYEHLRRNNPHCGNPTHKFRQKSKRWKGFQEISGDKWKNIRNNAKNRGIPLLITIQEAYQVFLNQNKQCAYTGLPLTFALFHNDNSGTASLDRIDSNKPYETSNVQWVHKDVNSMKWNLPHEKFIDVCKLVSSHNETH